MKIELDTREPLSDLDLRILALLLPKVQVSLTGEGFVTSGTEADLLNPKPEKAPEKAPERVFEDEMDRVITMATNLVSQGKSSEIREVLAKIGIERVSAIDSLEQLDAFEQALGPWL